MLAFLSTPLMLPIAIVTIVFFFVFLMVRGSAKERAERHRFHLVERALEHGHIDAQTKRELLAAVTTRPQRGSPFVVVGWLGLCAGVGYLIVLSTTYSPSAEMWSSAIMIVAVSFGLISLPLASRELSRVSRRHEGHAFQRGDS